MVATFSHADSIRLTNGDTVSGKLISFHDGLCVFNTPYGAPLSLKSDQIAALSMPGRYEFLFSNGEAITGEMSGEVGKGALIRSDNFGDVAVDFSSVTSVTRTFSNDEKATASQDSIQAHALGRQLDEDPPLDFLTGSTVLLSPGQYELDLGLVFKQSRTRNTLYHIDQFQKTAYSARMFELKSTLRAGLAEGLEGYFSVPVSYSHVEDVSSNQYVRDADSFSMADVRFGLQYQLLSESLDAPAVSLVLDVSAPTGKREYRDAATRWVDPLDNGSGHWSIAPGLVFVRTVDPAILFGGVSYRHFFANTFGEYRVEPGWVMSSYMGVGFGLNEKLSLGARMSYSYSANMKVNKKTIFGSDADPMDLSFNASYRLSDNWVVSPQVTLGLNPDAGSPALGINLRRRFN